MYLWIEFLLIAAVIILSGSRLSRYGDVIAEKTGLGRAWLGLALMASITSLPELITGVSSVAFAGVPEIAVGDIMGACVFNLLILAFLDPLEKTSPIFSRVGRSHVISSGFGIILISVVVLSLLAEGSIPSAAHIGLYTPVIVILYLAGVKTAYHYEKKFIKEMAAEAAEKLRYTHIGLRRAVTLYAVNACVVIAAAVLLPFVAARIAESTGMDQSFVGTFFVAFATTMPELAVSISAVRIGAYDLATGNLLGSNMFNVSLLAVDDALFTAGPIFSSVSTRHAVTGVAAIIMTALALIGITYRAEKRILPRLGWDSLAMIMTGVLSFYLIFLKSGRI